MEKNYDKALFRRRKFNPEGSEMLSDTNYSYWQSTLRTFWKAKTSRVLIVVIAVLVTYSFLYPLISRIDPNQVSLDTERWNAPASPGHWFGTDALGRDIWSRTWIGTRNSLMIALVIAIVEVGIGSFVGAIWGYVKKVDVVMLEVYNIVTNIPSTVYLVLLSYILKPSVFTIIFALASRGWISEAKFMRNKILTLRESEYNVASKSLGTPLLRVVSRNILPHLVSLIIMEAALTIPYSIGSEVFLGFIGLGLPQDMVTLGNMVNQGRANFMLYPSQMIFPSLVLCVITVSFYLLGTRFADASDPRNHV